MSTWASPGVARTTGQNHLAFTRFYNSLAVSSTFATSPGPHWRHTYDRYLRISTSAVAAERDDGRQLTFTLSNGVWTPDTDIDLKLTNSGSTWTLTGADDFIETYRRSAPPRRSCSRSAGATASLTFCNTTPVTNSLPLPTHSTGSSASLTPRGGCRLSQRPTT